MQYLQDFLNNRILIAALVAWAIAQAIKAILYTIVNREFKFERLVGSGGIRLSGGQQARTALARHLRARRVRPARLRAQHELRDSALPIEQEAAARALKRPHRKPA